MISSTRRQMKNDIILGIGLLVTALCLWLIMQLVMNNSGSEELVAVITVDGEEYAQYPLKSGITMEIFVDGHNKVIIDDGVVWMEEADCPDKLCMNQGRISKAGQTIICLPNRIMVTIKGGTAQYDGVAK